jgi:hypothetical protein
MTVALPERKIVMTSIKPAALTAAKWIGTGAGVSGVIMIALNLGLVIYGTRRDHDPEVGVRGYPGQGAPVAGLQDRRQGRASRPAIAVQDY